MATAKRFLKEWDYRTCRWLRLVHYECKIGCPDSRVYQGDLCPFAEREEWEDCLCYDTAPTLEFRWNMVKRK